MQVKSVVITLVLASVFVTGALNADGEAARGEVLAEYCADCHGDEGLGDGEFPMIAGMDAASMQKALMDFKSGERVDQYEIMADAAADLSEQDIVDLSAYYASLPGK